MNKEKTQEWMPLAQYERWVVDYRPDSRIVRLRMDDTTLYLEREAYQMLWGVVTLGLDELERVEDESGRMAGLARGAELCVAWPQTRH